MTERKDFGRVGERYRTFTWRIPRSEDVDEESDEADSHGASIFGDQKAKTSGEQRPSHLRKGEEKKCSSSEGVNRILQGSGLAKRSPITILSVALTKAGTVLGQSRQLLTSP